MKSRLLKTVLTLLAPVVIEYIIKKLTNKTQANPTQPTKKLTN